MRDAFGLSPVGRDRAVDSNLNTEQRREMLKAFAIASLSLQALGDPATLRPIVDEMVADGWLVRDSASPDSYRITEDGRLELAGRLDVTLYTRPGCHLCDEAKAQIAPLLRKARAQLREVNIDADEVLRERYNVDVPVIFLGSRKVAKHR